MGLVHQLAQKGDAGGLRKLIADALDVAALVNETDEAGYTPLFYAVKEPRPNLPTVEMLLRAGADPAYVRVERWRFPSFDWTEEMAEMTKEFGIEIPKDLDGEPREYRESLLSSALRAGNLDVVRMLNQHGADLGYCDENDYTAMLEAVYGDGHHLDLVRYLLELGVPCDTVSKYGESPISAAYQNGQFEVVAVLLRAGADESRLGWTPLHRAVALGTIDDLRREIEQGHAVEALDRYDRTALQLAAFRGEWSLVETLLLAGADPFRKADEGLAALGQAVLGKHEDLVLRLLEMGGSQEDKDAALVIAVEQGDEPTARMLLQAGADIHQKIEFSTLMEKAPDAKTIRLLLEHGADPADLETEGRRLLLSLPERDNDALKTVSKDEYLAHRFPRGGFSNPEDITNPFYLAMIRSGLNAYWARETFDDPATFMCGPVEARPPAVWCFDRFGQSTTILPDGRIVLIAGEHEDSYDPDFCIYNDVSVFEMDGAVTVYGYPYEVFPPTDFHTATLVDEWIYILGSLGYMGSRQGLIPAWRLSTRDFHIEPLQTSGERPGRLYKHRATLVNDHTVRITGGTVLSFKRKGIFKKKVEEEFGPNADVFELNLRSLVWSKVGALP